MRSLAAIMRQADAPPRARIQAIAILLDRGWGKVAQPHAGADGEGAIEIIIRDLAEERRQGLTSVCRTMLDAPPVSRCGSSGISSPEARTRLTAPPAQSRPGGRCYMGGVRLFAAASSEQQRLPKTSQQFE